MAPESKPHSLLRGDKAKNPIIWIAGAGILATICALLIALLPSPQRPAHPPVPQIPGDENHTQIDSATEKFLRGQIKTLQDQNEKLWKNQQILQQSLESLTQTLNDTAKESKDNREYIKYLYRTTSDLQKQVDNTGKGYNLPTPSPTPKVVNPFIGTDSLPTAQPQ